MLWKEFFSLFKEAFRGIWVVINFYGIILLLSILVYKFYYHLI